MSWVRLDDSFADHPKVDKLDDRSFRVFVWCLCYSARHLTDGFVSNRALRGSPAGAKLARLERTLGRLSDAGLIEPAEGGWRIHDYLDYNPNAASVKKERRRAAERQARWRESKKQKRNGVSNGVTDESVTPSPTPTPAPKGAGVGVGGGVPPTPERPRPEEERRKELSEEARRAHAAELRRANAHLLPPAKRGVVKGHFVPFDLCEGCGRFCELGDVEQRMCPTCCGVHA